MSRDSLVADVATKKQARRSNHAVKIAPAERAAWLADAASQAMRLSERLERLAFDLSNPEHVADTFTDRELERLIESVRDAGAALEGWPHNTSARLGFLRVISGADPFVERMRPVAAAVSARVGRRAGGGESDAVSGARARIRAWTSRELAARISDADIATAIVAWKKTSTGGASKWAALAEILGRSWSPTIEPITGAALRQEWLRFLKVERARSK